ncbi:hypothetical protein CsSME_00050213 [Camellia sinensis var. sinensis]
MHLNYFLGIFLVINFLQWISFLSQTFQLDHIGKQDSLVLSWHMKAATMCEFSKQEFIGEKFREIYDFAFGWAKEKGQKSLALDTAIGMWQLLFKQWPLVDHWCQFLQVA